MTGAAGFIGSHVARHLRDDDVDLVALDDLSDGYLDDVPEGIQFVEDSAND